MADQAEKERKTDFRKMIARALCSQLGICAMVILYCVAGGFIFQHLEQNNEQQICYDSRDEYNPVENKTIESLIKIISQYPNKEDQALNFQRIIARFRDNAIAIGYDGKDCGKYGLDGGPPFRWSWTGSLFFSITVITTIGYGHIAPKTFWGRLVCIAYAVLGIPLMLLCLANIGDVMANVFRFIYANICCFGCLRRKRKTKIVRLEPLGNPVNWRDTGNTTVAVKSAPPEVTEFSAFDDTKGKTVNVVRPLTPKFPVTKSTTKITPLEYKSQQSNIASKLEMTRKQDEALLDDSDDEDDLDETKVTVPLTVTMIVIGGYIFGGAVLFGFWEGWDWLQSAYFCFVTLSTIGFGDVVPGTDFESPQVQAQLILGCVYLLFGMAILSMCFSLMQDEIVGKFRWLGQKLGILNRDSDDDD